MSSDEAEGHQDYQEEFINDGEILEELALDNDQIDDDSMDDEDGELEQNNEEMQGEQLQQGDNMQEDIPDDSVQGFYGHNKEPVYGVAVHPLLPIAVSGGGDDQSMLWNYQSGELIAILASIIII